MCVLSIKVPMRKNSGNLFNDTRMLLPDAHLIIHNFNFDISKEQK